jgi:hypothetical protein
LVCGPPPRRNVGADWMISSDSGSVFIGHLMHFQVTKACLSLLCSQTRFIAQFFIIFQTLPPRSNAKHPLSFRSSLRRWVFVAHDHSIAILRTCPDLLVSWGRGSRRAAEIVRGVMAQQEPPPSHLSDSFLDNFCDSAHH